MSNDVNQLRRFINLPRTPAHASWLTTEVGPGRSNDWVLSAVLTFAPGEVEEIMKAATPASAEQSVLARAVPADQFPKELNQILDRGGAETWSVQGPRFDPAPFAKSPLLNGFFTRIGSTNAIFVYLFTT